MDQPLVVGIDAGGTSVRVRVLQSGATRGHAAGAADPNGGPGTLGQTLRAALNTTGAKHLDIRAGCAGITKITRPGVREAWQKSLGTLFPHLPNSALRVEPDFVTAFHGAIPSGVGIAVIAGTGSVVYGEDGKGGTVRVGGRGWEFGDEGSGAFLTTEAIRRTLRALDGLEQPTPLNDAIIAAFGTGDPADFAQAARERATEAGRGFLVPLLLQRAGAGDTEARDLFTGAAGWLAAYVRAAHSRLQLTSPVTVAIIGGIWEAGLFILPPFEAVLNRWLPGVQLVSPVADPATGAALLAGRLPTPYTQEGEPAPIAVSV